MQLNQALRIRRQDVISLVGGGGKTSAMFCLGNELSAQGWRVILTTSTQIGADQIPLAASTIILTEEGGSRPSQPENQLSDHESFVVATTLRRSSELFTVSPTLLLGGVDTQIDKGVGLEPNVIDRILPEFGVDVVINEADGARMRPFKAPANHEPVIPSSSTLVVPVVGLDVIGQPLDDIHVHRPERVAALTGAELKRPITPETVAATLVHPQGGLRRVPPGARVAILINKVHTASEVRTAQRLAELLLVSQRVDSVVVGAVQESKPVGFVRERVAVVVLAAGESRRFGQLKQLQAWGQGTLLTHAVDVALASRAERVIVVLGCQADACRAALGSRPVRIIVNPDWAAGQSTSVRAGLVALDENVGATVFHLGDQPGVTAATINALIERHATTLAPVIWPEYHGRRGNPVLFDRTVFPELNQLTGDQGGKPVVLAYARTGLAERVAVDDSGILMDIDTPQDMPNM